MISAN